MDQDHEIIFEKGLRGKVTISFKSGFKYGITIDWKANDRPITKVKKGNKDYTDLGTSFVISNQRLTDGETNIKFTKFEAVDRDGKFHEFKFNNNNQIVEYSSDLGLVVKYLFKNEERYIELTNKKFDQILNIAVAAYAEGIDDEGKEVKMNIVNNHIYDIW